PLVELEPDRDTGLETAGEPEERIPRTRERVDDDRSPDCCSARDCGDVSADPGREPVAGALDDPPAPQPHTAPLPAMRPESVDAPVAGVAEAVAPVLLDLPKREQLIPLRPEKQTAVVAASLGSLRHAATRLPVRHGPLVGTPSRRPVRAARVSLRHRRPPVRPAARTQAVGAPPATPPAAWPRTAPAPTPRRNRSEPPA